MPAYRTAGCKEVPGIPDRHFFRAHGLNLTSQDSRQMRVLGSCAAKDFKLPSTTKVLTYKSRCHRRL